MVHNGECDAFMHADIEGQCARRSQHWKTRRLHQQDCRWASYLKQRFRPEVGWLILVVLLGWRPLELLALPGWILKAATVAGALFVAHGLIIFRRWNDELKELPKFLIIFTAAVIELLIENYCVWYDKTFVPLQDNVAIVTRGVMAQSAVVEWLVSWHWAHIANFLVAFLCVPFSCAWDQIPYSGFSIASRALLMHVIVRIVRTASFLAVVLPNARTSTCYGRRFPPVPDQMLDYIWTGMSTLKGFGGCNDLILSGHACTWMMTVLTCWTYYPYGGVKYVVWLAYIQTSIRTAVEGWHYSVDFILPAALCWFIWRDLDWVCPKDQVLNVRTSGRKDPTSRIALVVVGAAVVFCIINAFFVGA